MIARSRPFVLRGQRVSIPRRARDWDLDNTAQPVERHERQEVPSNASTDVILYELLDTQSRTFAEALAVSGFGPAEVARILKVAGDCGLVGHDAEEQDRESSERPDTAPLSKLPLPRVAPTLWKDRKPGVTAPEFLQENYGLWLDRITTRYLRKLDPKFAKRWEDYTSERTNKRETKQVPENLKLHTEVESGKSWMERLLPQLSEPNTLPTLRDAQQLEAAARSIRRMVAKAQTR